MNPGGDAAEQVVRLSLEGVEVAAKISGNGAKNIALLLYATLKQEQKTKGKARLTSMLKSGKELKVYTITQKDLPKDAVSGLDVAIRVLKDVDEIGFCYLTSKDVVRHPLVQRIVNAYEKYEKRQEARKEKRTVSYRMHRRSK